MDLTKKRCKRCKNPVIVAMSPLGKTILVDSAPYDEGNVRLSPDPLHYDDPECRPVAIVLKKNALLPKAKKRKGSQLADLEADDGLRYRLHKSTCPAYEAPYAWWDDPDHWTAKKHRDTADAYHEGPDFFREGENADRE
jgi:hypothetical protein